MMQLPTLTLPDFTLPFKVTTDASIVAIGAVLSQNHHPLSFFSKKLGPRMSSSSTYIRELYGGKEMTTILIGHPFQNLHRFQKFEEPSYSNYPNPRATKMAHQIGWLPI